MPPNAPREAPPASPSPARRPQWWRWGEGGIVWSAERLDRLRDYLEHRLGAPSGGPLPPPVPLSSLHFPPSRLREDELAELRQSLSLGAVSVEGEERLVHSVGRGYLDLLDLRSGKVRQYTDAVVHPATAEEVVAVLRFAEAHDLAVIPYGGGTSPTGGIDPDPGGHRGVITLSLGRLIDPLGLDSTSALARFQAGIRGPELEKSLRAEGFTLAFFPGSFEHTTLGGWIATGRGSDAVGRDREIRHLVRGLTVATPRGILKLDSLSDTALGPDPAGLFVGSEGTLGVIVEASVAVHRQPGSSAYRAALYPDWASGLEAVRTLAQGPSRPSLLRLLDAAATEVLLECRRADPGLGARVRERLEPRFLEMRHLEEGTMTLVLHGWQGSEAQISEGERRAREVRRELKGVDLGTPSPDLWQQERFAFAHLQEEMLEQGWFIDRLETNAAWSELTPLALSVPAAIAEEARRGQWALLVTTSLSHASTTGATLHFRLYSPQDPKDPALQARRLLDSGARALREGHASLGCSEGVGTRWRAELALDRAGAPLELLRAVKQSLDPKGILNPGKMLPP